MAAHESIDENILAIAVMGALGLSWVAWGSLGYSGEPLGRLLGGSWEPFGVPWDALGGLLQRKWDQNGDWGVSWRPWGVF